MTIMSLYSKLILTDGPRLFYVDPTKMEIKGEIPWSKDVKVVVNSEKQFDVTNGGSRVYHITDILGTAQQWYDAVEGLLNAPPPFL